MSPASASELAREVEAARARYLEAMARCPAGAGECRPPGEGWSLAEITEHLVRAEQVGVLGMWRALEGRLSGRPVWTGDRPWTGLAIEEVVARTWGENVEAPDVAAPRLGGPLAFWSATLAALSGPLADLAAALTEQPLEEILYPHPISGPLDARQRLEFLRFHLDRHCGQAERVLASL